MENTTAILQFLQLDSTQKFIREAENEDVNKLILNPPVSFKGQIKIIAEQILSRQKAKGKLNHWLNKENILFPPPLSIEQSSSEATAKYKQTIVQGSSLIDLSGGMGVDCLAMSEKFENTTYIEQNEWLCELFKHNSRKFHQEILVRNTKAEDFIQELSYQPNTTIFIDPARRDQNKSKVFRLQDCTPDIVDLLPLIKQKADKLLVKLSPLLDIQLLITTIPDLTEIHIVSVKNECKEVLAYADFTKKVTPRIITTNLSTEQPTYSFQLQEEQESTSQFSLPKTYLYEPNSSILKSGAFKKIAQDYHLDKIAPNTHLYTSNEVQEKFPGKVFEIKQPSINKKNISNYAENGKINVITRNYPLNANELKKKMKVRDGGKFYLIGFKNIKDKAELVVGEIIKTKSQSK